MITFTDLIDICFIVPMIRDERICSRQNKAEKELGRTSEQTVREQIWKVKAWPEHGPNKQTLMDLEDSEGEVSHSGELLQ